MQESPGDGARLSHYEAFVAVVETGNLTRAAKQLRRSLQSVSRSLAALEEQVGVVLVRRTTRRAEPTDAGQAFYRRVSGALREIGVAEAELRDGSGSVRGAIRLAGSAFFVGQYVVPAIGDFTRDHPGVTFDLRIGETFADPVGEGIDLMIRVGRLPASPLRVRKLAMLRRVLVASPTYLTRRGRPEVPEDLARHTAIVRSTAQDARAWTLRGPDGTARRIPIEGSFESDSAYVTKQAARAGLGIALAPFFQVRDSIEVSELEVLLPDCALDPIPVHAVLPSDGRTPTRVRRFVEFLAQRLKKEMV